MQEFKFSEKTLKRNYKFCFLAILIAIPGVFLITVLAGKTNIHTLLVACGITAVILLLILAIELPLLNRSMRKMKVIIEDDRIIKQYSRGHKNFFWSDIDKVKMKKNPKGEHINIRIHGRDKRSIYIYGFERMGEIATLICEKTPNDTTIDIKQNKFDYQGYLFLTLLCITTLIVTFFVRSASELVEDIFEISFAVVAGLFLLIYKPIYKTNPSLKKLEKLLAIVMLLGGLCILIGMLIPD